MIFGKFWQTSDIKFGTNQSIYASINIGHSVHIFSQFTIEINIETKNSLTPIVNFTQNSNIIKLNATLKGIIKI
jgi:hypothetical protein